MRALAVASGIVFWSLVLGVTALLFMSGGDGAEPVAVVQIDTAPPPARPSSPNAIGLPPGFSVTGPAVSPAAPRPAAPTLAPPGQGTSMMPTVPGAQIRVPPPPPPPGPSGALEPDRLGPAEPDEKTEDVAEVPARPRIIAANLAPGIDKTAEDALPDVPEPAIVEDSPYGPLPKVAADGRRPADVYARPSDYAEVAGGPPRVAVLLNGLGVPGAPSGDIIKGLPPPVSLAFGPYGRGLQERVTEARAAGHEVLLAIPLEPNNYPKIDPGPNALLTSLPPKDNIKRLQFLMSRYTGYVGVTNYMGAKFETELGAVAPMLEEVKRRGLLFVDNGSVKGSVAPRVATALEIEHATAHVRLDDGRMDRALAKLEAMAKEKGAAIGVAKAGPATVRQIADWAGSLEDKGLVLVPISAAIRSPRAS